MFAESGAAYHTNQTGGEASQLEIQSAWINGCSASRIERLSTDCSAMNTTMYATCACISRSDRAHLSVPRLKSWFMFEHAKTEYDGGVRDRAH